MTKYEKHYHSDKSRCSKHSCKYDKESSKHSWKYSEESCEESWKHSESHDSHKKRFAGYANPYSTLPAPQQPNVNEYFPLDNIDTNDWTIDPRDNTVLICNNPGVWQVTAQYQLVGINATTNAADATIDGWFNLNGEDVPASDATQYASRVNAKSVLVVALSGKLRKGDRVKLGVRSSSLNGELNVQCRAAVATTGILAPSIIITAIKAGKH